ncbi:MAG TPA: glycosyltransferase family 4 protein [Chitinophagales bacterium]|nr:glycosyltransferase family 4 protein [Chitinophagales bacterium]
MKSIPRKILIISTEFPPVPGGIGTHAYFLANELHLLGWQVEVFTEQFELYEKEVAEFERTCKFTVYRAQPTPTITSLIIKLYRIFITIIRFKPDIIAGTGKHAVWFAVLMSKLTLKKCVAIGHGTEFTIAMSDFSKKVNRWAYSSADALITVSDFTRDVAKKTGIRNNRCITIYNGADGRFFRMLDKESVSSFKKSKGIEHSRIIITVGNVSDRKGQEYVIRALRKVSEKFHDTHYYCAGHSTVKDKLASLARELGLADRVHFLGKVPADELLLWLNACDLYCLTSIVTDEGDFEGFGISVIEAALCGKPAIESAEAGVAESVIDGKTGLRVPPKDTHAIADSILLLFEDDELRQRLGHNALQNALDNLTWEKVVKRYEEVLLNII